MEGKNQEKTGVSMWLAAVRAGAWGRGGGGTGRPLSFPWDSPALARLLGLAEPALCGRMLLSGRGQLAQKPSKQWGFIGVSVVFVDRCPLGVLPPEQLLESAWNWAGEYGLARRVLAMGPESPR